MVHLVTQYLMESAYLDIWPTLAACVDFGISNQEIYNAYYKKIRREEVTAEQLDEALGNGPKLTALIGITITTAYDGMEEEE
jgi:hypothetical protein